MFTSKAKLMIWIQAFPLDNLRKSTYMRFFEKFVHDRQQRNWIYEVTSCRCFFGFCFIMTSATINSLIPYVLQSNGSVDDVGQFHYFLSRQLPTPVTRTNINLQCTYSRSRENCECAQRMCLWKKDVWTITLGRMCPTCKERRLDTYQQTS